MDDQHGLEILYTGAHGGTCAQRAAALRELGHRVTHVPAEEPTAHWRFQLFRVVKKLYRPTDVLGSNRRVVAEARRSAPDVLWVDKGLTIRASTLRAVRALGRSTALVHYSPDDMMNPGNQSTHYLRGVALYDLHVTTKTYNVPELRDLGAHDVFYVDNAYDPATHRPIELTDEERRRFTADVGFVGSYESDRAEQMLWLARNGIRVHVWGGGWGEFRESHPDLVIHKRSLDGLEYAKAIVATRINLGFLRKVNRDLQTTRSIEIPACRAFMLAERTDEHLSLFDEGREAEFFGSREELLEKCRHYLDHEDQRRQIADAGYRRCIEGGYCNRERLRSVLDYLRDRGRLPDRSKAGA